MKREVEIPTRGGLLRAHFAARARLVAIAVAIGAAGALATTAPAERSVAGVASMLGEAAGGSVGDDDFVWEERQGFWADTIVGRRVLFLAAPREGAGPRDLHRARVRLTRDGRPLAVRTVRNLSRTPVGDEGELHARGRHAAMATRAYDRVQGVTLLDLDGEARAHGAIARLQQAASAWLDTGSTEGIRRTEIVPSREADELRFELTETALVLALGKERHPAAVALDGGALNPGPGDPYGLRTGAVTEAALTARGLVARVARGAAGPRVSAIARDALRGLRGAKTVGAQTIASAPPATEPGVGAWPPPPIAGADGWTALGGEAGEAAMVRTTVRPDDASLVTLVAIDARRLDLRFEAGARWPSPWTGVHGRGRLPARPFAIVAAFNGGDDDALGAVVDGRVLVPPQGEAPTVAIARGGAWLGPWPHATAPLLSPPRLDIDAIGAIASLRQSPEALVDRGVVVPDAAGGSTARSALGVTPEGRLVYAWSGRATRGAVAEAVRLAGCAYAVALASDRAPLGFATHAGCEGEPGALVDAAMSLDPRAICGRSEGDFFYLVGRDAAPTAPLPEGAWAVDPGAQPEPQVVPAIHTATVAELGAQVRLLAVAKGRFAWKVRAGGREPRRKTEAPLAEVLDDGDLARAALSLSVGLARKRGGSGIVVDGVEARPLRSSGGALVVDRDGAIAVDKLPLARAPEGGSAIELPLLADEGALLRDAREIGSRRPRAAACVLDDGTFMLASSSFDSDEATTEALLAVGCRRVVALDRGTDRSFFMGRRGTDAPPQATYEDTVLFALDAQMRGAAGVLSR